MPKQYRIRIRGKQRDDIDVDLLAQALLMIAEDLKAEQDQQKNEQQDTEPPENT